MKNYVNLISQNIIDFDKLMLDKYYLLNLKENEVIILIRLNKFLVRGNNTLQINDIYKTMSITKEECSQIIIDLVTKGFITLEFSSIESKETFNLNETYNRLALILNNEDSSLENEENISLEKEIVILLERELKKTLSSIELQIVSHWIYEYHYTYDEIMEAVVSSLKNKNHGVKYIDRFLYNKHKEQEKAPESSGDVKEIFNRVYGNH